MDATPAPLYPYDTYLYAATPTPRKEHWLGWDRFNFGIPRFAEMALSVSYNPEWEVWLRVSPAGSHLAATWAAKARRQGYYVAYPVAHDPDPDARKVLAHSLRAALRFFERRRRPNGEEAQRAKANIKPYRGRDPVTGEYMPNHNRLSLFPKGLPDCGMDLRVPHRGREMFKAGAVAKLARRLQDSKAREQTPAGTFHRPRPQFPAGRHAPLGTIL